jgi:hypothetical protein
MSLNHQILKDNFPLKSQNEFFSNIRLHFRLKEFFLFGDYIADKMTLREFSSELIPSLIFTIINAEYTFC